MTEASSNTSRNEHDALSGGLPSVDEWEPEHGPGSPDDRHSDRPVDALAVAFADPPYLGCCGLYGHRHEAPYGCWNDPETHHQLIDWLVAEYPDGWALCASVPSLRTLLPMMPEDVRVGSWVKTFSAFKKGVRPAYAWEPVIWRGGRNPGAGFPHKPPERGGKQNTPKDFYETHTAAEGLACPITLQKGLTGAKPEAFCRWVLDLLNVQPGDIVVDLFPGTGVMGVASADRGCQWWSDFGAPRAVDVASSASAHIDDLRASGGVS